MRFLARMREMADRVYVGLASDEIIARNKNRQPFYNYDIRREMLLHTRYVGEVLCHSGPVDGSGRVLIIQQKLDFIRAHGITLVVMGSDWEGEYGFIEPYCEVRYLPRTEGVSTSGIALSLSTS